MIRSVIIVISICAFCLLYNWGKYNYGKQYRDHRPETYFEEIQTLEQSENAIIRVLSGETFNILELHTSPEYGDCKSIQYISNDSINKIDRMLYMDYALRNCEYPNAPDEYTGNEVPILLGCITENVLSGGGDSLYSNNPINNYYEEKFSDLNIASRVDVRLDSNLLCCKNAVYYVYYDMSESAECYLEVDTTLRDSPLNKQRIKVLTTGNQMALDSLHEHYRNRGKEWYTAIYYAYVAHYFNRPGLYAKGAMLLKGAINNPAAESKAIHRLLWSGFLAGDTTSYRLLKNFDNNGLYIDEPYDRRKNIKNKALKIKEYNDSIDRFWDNIPFWRWLLHEKLGIDI